MIPATHRSSLRLNGPAVVVLLLAAVLVCALPTLYGASPRDPASKPLPATPTADAAPRVAEKPDRHDEQLDIARTSPKTASDTRSIPELLGQISQSPLGPAEAALLKGVSDLVNADQEAGIEHPKRLIIRLHNVSAADAAKALQEFREDKQKTLRAAGQAPHVDGVVVLPEPITNCLLLSGKPEVVDSLMQLVPTLDAAQPMVCVSVCIAEFLPATGGVKADGGSKDATTAEKAPSMEEDGAAWLRWARTQRRLEVLSQPKVMTIDKQAAVIKVGQTVPSVPTLPAPDAARRIPARKSEVGLTVHLTPQISSDGSVVMELDVEQAVAVNRQSAVGATIEKTAVQTAISAKDGQTIVLGGMTRVDKDGPRQLIVAVTPRVVNPKR